MSNYKLETGAGDSIDNVAKKAKDIAKEKGVTVEFDFNDIVCFVNSETYVDGLVRDYKNAHIMEWKAVGPKCEVWYDADTEIILYTRKLKRAKEKKELEIEQRKKDKKAAADFERSVKGIKMEFSDKDAWREGRAINLDPYGNACYVFAEGWAKLMQIEIAKGIAVKDCAKEASQKADYMGITGFMYGCAVNILSRCWRYGEELRKWHNKEYGVSEDKKGVVNPAVLTIG